MTEEEKLQKAYFILGLQPGDPFDKVLRRHKRLVVVWHPDRFPTADGKKDAEEELKQINNARDDLKSHFEKSHKASGPCPCKPGAASQDTYHSSGGRSGSGAGPGPGKRKTTQETHREEAEAQRKSKEREARAAAEAAEKERQRRAAASPEPPQQTAQQAADQTKLLEDERLRWKVAVCIGAAWIGLSLFGWMGTSLKSWWHDFSWKWQNDHQPHSDSSTNGSNIGSGSNTNTNDQPYVAPYNQAPSQNSPTQWQDPYANNAQAPPNNTIAPPPSDTTSAPPLTSIPSLQSTTPNLSVPSDPLTVRQRASDFLNNTGSSSSPLNIPYTPHVMPTNTPVTPSNDVSNSFSRTLEEINKKSGQ
jgi:curved DNA-binding protein CbpA